MYLIDCAAIGLLIFGFTIIKKKCHKEKFLKYLNCKKEIKKLLIIVSILLPKMIVMNFMKFNLVSMQEYWKSLSTIIKLLMLKR